MASGPYVATLAQRQMVLLLSGPSPDCDLQLSSQNYSPIS